MSYSSNMIRSMMGGYGMPGGPGFGAPGMNMAMPQMDPNMARQLALQRMQQASAQRMQQQRPQSGGPMPQMPPMVWGGQQGGMQPPFGMQSGPIQKGPMQQTGNPPMNMAMPMQGQSFGPQDMNQVGAQGGMSDPTKRLQQMNFGGVRQAMQQGPQKVDAFANPTPAAEIARQMGWGAGSGAVPEPMRQQGGLWGMFGQQPSAAVGSQMGASQAQANQQAMAQQAPAQQPRRNPYGMSMDMMARMNPNAARYYGGG